MGDQNNPFASSHNYYGGIPPPSQNQQHHHHENVDPNQPFLQDQTYLMGARPKNFPRCFPIVHHNISTDIPPEKRTLVRKVLFGWAIHVFCLAWNLICMTAALIVGQTLGGFFIALAGFILGTPVSFFVYWLFYSAVRKGSSFNFAMWFCMFACQILLEILWAIGIVSTGGGGFFLMIKAFGEKRIPLGVMDVLCFIFFAGVVVYNLFLLIQGRREYKLSGGHKAAGKEFGNAAVGVAYDNRESIKQFAKDNKETIKRVAIENKDTIIDFASENKDVIAKVAIDNKDTIWENRDTVKAVF